ncbi:MAG: hypothetical protein NTY37_10240 [Methanothrix sp.]|nr:hypothetical protein [Methanothrix sp.]
MNHIKTMGILVIIAALMFVPQVLADIQVGFGTPYISAGSTITSPGIYFDQSNVLNRIGGNDLSLTSVGGASSTSTPGAGGALAQYWQAQSPDAKYIAASYAYLTGSASYSYKFVPTSTTSSASVTGHVVATNAEGINFGGFAYNGKAFASVDVVGCFAKQITYDNALYASSSKVSAQQTFSAIGADNFKISAFAAKGAFVPAVPVAGLPVDYTKENNPVTDNPALAAGQFATITGGDIKSYKSSASVSDTTATASQKADITKVTPKVAPPAARPPMNEEAEAQFWGFSWQSKGDTSAGAQTYADIEGVDGGNLKNVGYNAVATSTSTGTASASQDSIKAQGAKSFEAGAWSESGKGLNALGFAAPWWGVDFLPEVLEGKGIPVPSLHAGQHADLYDANGMEITSYKSAAFVDGKTATASQALSTKGNVYDAEFWGHGGMWNAYADTYAAAMNSLYIDDAKNLNYKAASAGTSMGAASASQEVTSDTASDLDANIEADSNRLNARQSAKVEANDDDLFQVKTYKSAASVDANTAKASQSANLPSIKDGEYYAAFCGSAGQFDADKGNLVYAQAAIAAHDAQDVVYSANSVSTQTVTATASQAFSASEVNGIIADALATNEEFEFVTLRDNGINILDDFFADGPYLAAAQGALLQGKDVKVTSYTSGASVNTKTAFATQNAKTVGTLSTAAFVGGSIQESDEYEFSAAVTGAFVDNGKDVSYDGKVTSASNVQATGSQTLTAKSADAVVQAAVAVNQNDDSLQYAGSVDLAGDVYGQQLVRDADGHPISIDSNNKVTSYSGIDSVSTMTDAKGKVTTTAINTLNAQGGFLGRAIAAGKGDAITGGNVLEQLPLTLNPAFNGGDLRTATKNIIPVANPDVDAVGVVGETLVFAPILSNDGFGPIIADRESNQPNKNSLSGKSTATVITDNMGKTTSTLSGYWKLTAQKDTTPIGKFAPHDTASVHRFAYASDDVDEIFASQPSTTFGGVATISYNEKAKEIDGAFPTASVV